MWHDAHSSFITSDTAMAQAKTSFYLSIWRQGFKQQVDLPCVSVAEANSIRLKMYVAGRPYRSLEGKETRRRDGTVVVKEAKGLEDPEMHEAVTGCEIVIKPHEDGSATLTVRPEWMNERLMRLSAATGIPFGPVDEMAESQRRFLEKMAREGLTSEPSVGLANDAYETVELARLNQGGGLYDE